MTPKGVIPRSSINPPNGSIQHPDVSNVISDFSLTVGLCTVMRSHNYLTNTIDSLISNMSGKSIIKIIVYQCDWEGINNTNVEESIKIFEKQINSGLLKFVRVSDHSKFGLQKEGATSNYISWRTKQNYDFSEAFRLSVGLSDFYMHIEDDIKSCKNYDLYVAYEIQKQRCKLMRIGAGGFIGWVFHNDLVLPFSQELILKSKDKPCDWIIEEWEQHKYFPKYSIFQHMGSNRSLEGQTQPVIFHTFIG